MHFMLLYMHDYRHFKATEPAGLKKIIVDLYKKQQQYSFEIELLREQVSHLYNKLFGRKSEKDMYAG